MISDALKTTGDLRKLIARQLRALETGDLPVDKASAIAKMARALNDSFFAECRVAKLHFEQPEAAEKFGSLSLAPDDSEGNNNDGDGEA